MSVRSAYFYRNIIQLKNNTFPDYIPPLKHISRFEPEPLGIASQGGVGMAKSFSKLSTLVATGSHMCREIHNMTKKPTQSYLNPEDILIHHYRKHCQSVHGDDDRCADDDEQMKSKLVYDDSLHRFADIIIPKVEKVLRIVNYLKE